MEANYNNIEKKNHNSYIHHENRLAAVTVRLCQPNERIRPEGPDQARGRERLCNPELEPELERSRI